LALYQLEVGHVTVPQALETAFSSTADEALEMFLAGPRPDDEAPAARAARLDMRADVVHKDERLRSYVENTVKGTWERRSALDDLIRVRADKWRPERMARTDLNILRMAAYELTEQKAIPAAVTVNEAVELAKSFGEDESGKFVNGILGAILADGSKDAPDEP
jgi:N utilization substance protein B